MPIELWGASSTFQLGLPNDWQAYLLLLGYLVLTFYLFYTYQQTLKSSLQYHLNWTIGLALAAFITSQLFIVEFASNVPAIDGKPVAALALFALIPILLASAILHPVSAFLVGCASGLGLAVGQTHTIVDVFTMAFTAVSLALLMQQNYRGQVYRWLREPLVAAGIGTFILTFLMALSIFVSLPLTGLAALDRTIVAISLNFWAFLIAFLLAGLVVTAVLRSKPELKPKRHLTPSPTQTSLKNRLISYYTFFAVILIFIGTAIGYMVLINTSTQAFLSAMTINVNNAVTTLEAQPASSITTIEAPKPISNQKYYITSPGELLTVQPDGSTIATTPEESWLTDQQYMRAINTNLEMGGDAYQGWNADGTRALIYTNSPSNYPVTFAAVEPYTAVLRRTMQIVFPLFLLLIVTAVGIIYGNSILLDREVSAPVNEIAQAADTIASGDSWTPTRQIERADEIGSLNRSFVQMQRSMRKQVNELSLLLSISQDVAKTIDINKGLPVILQGLIRGTAAAGARAVVLNPSGGKPLIFGQGPAAKEMSLLDRKLMAQIRIKPELILTSAKEIYQTLELPSVSDAPLPTILAIELRTHNRFQGMIWLGYRHVNNFETKDWELLKTLAGQAAVLVENARLYSTAEGGRRRLAAVLASTSDAVIVTDHTERILLINRAAEQIFGLKAHTVSGRSVTNVISDKALVEALTGNDGVPRSVEVQMENDKIYYANASTIISKEGQVFGRVAVLRDITYLKEIDEMKSEFVSTVSHDLRSPLTFMRGYTTMLPMVGELNEKQSEYIDKILLGIDQMTQLVDDLLDLGRIEAGVDLVDEEFGVRPLLEDIAEEYWQHAHLAGLKLAVDVGQDVSTMKGDRALIKQAITNLATNAIKYAPNSGDLVLKAEQLEDELIFSINDNGPGIPKQDQHRLFEKFYRVQQRGTEKIKGSGMGLAIVKSIAEKHDGRVWCISQPGQGTSFFIGIPNSAKSKLNGSPTSNE